MTITEIRMVGLDGNSLQITFSHAIENAPTNADWLVADTIPGGPLPCSGVDVAAGNTLTLTPGAAAFPGPWTYDLDDTDADGLTFVGGAPLKRADGGNVLQTVNVTAAVYAGGGPPIVTFDFDNIVYATGDAIPALEITWDGVTWYGAESTTGIQNWQQNAVYPDADPGNPIAWRILSPPVPITNAASFTIPQSGEIPAPP